MIKFLKWDSEFFKKNIYGVELDGAFQAVELNKIFDEMRCLNADGGYIFFKQSNKPCQDALKALDIPLIDEKITYEKILSASNPVKAQDSVKPYNGPVTRSLINLSIEAGKYSRFKADKLLADKFEELYTLWIKRSLCGLMDDAVLVFTEYGIQKGMVTFKIENSTGTIGLIGVDPLLQGQGVGTELILAVENYYITNHILISRVSTQLHNEAACRFYTKMGYTVQSVQPIYHVWF